MKTRDNGMFSLLSESQSEGKMRSCCCTCGQDLTRRSFKKHIKALFHHRNYCRYLSRNSGTLPVFKLKEPGAKFNSKFIAPAPQKAGDSTLGGV